MNAISRAGGIFAFLTFCHFIADWIFQSHATAMKKHNNWRVRGDHCADYTLLMGFVLLAVGLRGQDLYLSCVVLFVSHFVEDTYWPVYLWARYVRRVPEVRERGHEGFVEFIGTPLGKILIITVDQIIHLVFLWLPAWLAVRTATVP